MGTAMRSSRLIFSIFVSSGLALERLRRASPGTSVQLSCDLALDQAAGQLDLTWSQRQWSSQEESLVTSLKIDEGQSGEITNNLEGFTSLLVPETVETLGDTPGG